MTNIPKSTFAEALFWPMTSEIMGISGGSVGVSISQWESLEVSGSQWELVGVSGSQWESVGVRILKHSH